MVTARRFEELDAWQLSTELDELVCSIAETGKCRDDLEFCDQIRRASQNAPPLARGELAEVQSRLRHARKQKFFTDEQWQSVWTLAGRAMGATTNLLKSKLPLLKKQSPKPRDRSRRR